MYSDSQTSINALENHETTSRLVREAKYALNALVRINRVIVTWTLGHLLARYGTERLLTYNRKEKCGHLAWKVAISTGKPPMQKNWSGWNPRDTGVLRNLLGKYITIWSEEIIKLDRRRALYVIGIMDRYCDLRC